MSEIPKPAQRNRTLLSSTHIASETGYSDEADYIEDRIPLRRECPYQSQLMVNAWHEGAARRRQEELDRLAPKGLK